jgi:diguanylate cyclase (GGDEF)-like protein
MLTGAGNEELVRLALKSGAADYLMKDARLEYVRHLPQALAAAVSAWQAQQAAERQQSDLERLTAELDALANRDSLTGLWNRRYLDATLRHEIERTRRYARPLACLMVDLDGFKGINDTHGHLAGDRVLAAVARTLSDALRVSDYCCRFGGDEFVIVAPETDLNGAVVLARRVSQAVSEAAVREGSVCLQVTASIGVATFTGAPDVGGEALLQAADQALLVAKSHGPGRVATDREVRRGAAA